MKDTPPHLRALEEVEEAGIPGLLEVLREEGTAGVRYALWTVSGWHRDYSPPVWRNRATEEQKREGWEMAVHIEKIIARCSMRPTSGRSRRSWKPRRGAGEPVQATTLLIRGLAACRLGPPASTRGGPENLLSRALVHETREEVIVQGLPTPGRAGVPQAGFLSSLNEDS